MGQRQSQLTGTLPWYVTSAQKGRARSGLLQEQVTSDLWWREVLQQRMYIAPKPYPKGFRDDVVRVARNREPGQHL
jgi:hypothetical protein